MKRWLEDKSLPYVARSIKAREDHKKSEKEYIKKIADTHKVPDLKPGHSKLDAMIHKIGSDYKEAHVKAAKANEEVEQVDELNFGQAIKSVVGKSDTQVAAKAKGDFEARKAKLLAKAKTMSTSKPTKSWDNGSYDTTTKRGTQSEAKTEIDGKYFDEIEGAGQFKSAKDHIKTAPHSAIKMMATKARNKYTSHTGQELPGTKVTEEVEQIDELSNSKLSDYKKAVASKSLAKDGDRSSGGILRTATKRLEGFKAASKKMGESIEQPKADEPQKVDEQIQIDELSSDTIRNYQIKAAGSLASASRQQGYVVGSRKPNDAKADKTVSKRLRGIVKSSFKAQDKIKEEITMLSFRDFLKTDRTEYEVIGEEIALDEIAEAFIDHDSFEDRLKAHRTSGRVVHHSYDHEKEKAVIRHVDKEGEVRQYNYHSKGTTVQRLAPQHSTHHVTPEGKRVDKPMEDRKPRGRQPGSKHVYKARAEKVAEDFVDESTKSDIVRDVHNHFNAVEDGEGSKHKAELVKKRGKEGAKHIINAAKAGPGNFGPGPDPVPHYKTMLKTAINKNIPEEFELIDEGVRLVGTHGSGKHIAKVYKDSDLGEHRVKFYSDGKHHKDADYFTDDKEDAHGTARAILSKMNSAK